MLQARALEAGNQGPGRLLHPGNAMLRRAIQENVVSFPSQIPVFSRQARPEMQWKAVLLYFVRAWPIGDIAARFRVGSHRIAQVVNEWATRALALGYIQVIDPERFAAWGEARIGTRENPVWAFEQCARVRGKAFAEESDKGWLPSGSLRPADSGMVTALDVAIRRCEQRPGEFWSQAPTLPGDLRSAIEAARVPRPKAADWWFSRANKLSAASKAPAEELPYASKY